MDWIGVALSIIGMYLLPKHYHYAIALFIVSNPSTLLRTGFVWTVYGIGGGIWSIVGLQCVFFALNVRAWRKGA